MGRYSSKLHFLMSAVLVLPAQGVFAACGPDMYFSESDYDHKAPMAAPSREFAEDMRMAKAGSRTGQRNVAVSYEAGYLVGKCDEKAAYWYAKAAKGGDDIAIKWVAARNYREKFSIGPECIGPGCDPDADDGPQYMSLSASGTRGHFFATITINGVSVVGMIDTGASTVAMSPATAALLGISGEGFSAQKVNTANGVTVAFDKVIPRMKVGPLSVSNVEISVAPNTTMTLIGMSALRQLKMSAVDGLMTLSK